MTFDAFKASLQATRPPAGVSPALQALWYDAKDDWHRAHDIAQDIPGEDGSWMHAYLHRKEGDQGNAAYWYRRAGRPMPDVSLSDEWELIARELLTKTVDG